MQSNKIEPMDSIDESKIEKMAEASQLLPDNTPAAQGEHSESHLVTNPLDPNDQAATAAQNMNKASEDVNSSDDEKVTEIDHKAMSSAKSKKFAEWLTEEKES